ncbi:MAG: type IV secretion system family protein, partial [Alcaligenaceae bacterium]
MRKNILAIALAASAMLIPMQARAGIPVIDFAALANLIQQIMYWQQQISAMKDQLGELEATKDQLQQTHASMTGNRGMGSVLPTTNLQRNYLPQNYSDLMGILEGSSSGYSGLSSQVQSIMAANSVLSKSQMDLLSSELRQIVERGRQASAMLNGATRTAYQNSSNRFGALQQLVSAIGQTSDPKAIAELQARIQAEQNMLTNEQTKLQSLYQ